MSVPTAFATRQAQDVARHIGTVIRLADGRTRTVRDAKFGCETVTLLFVEGPSDTYRRTYELDVAVNGGDYHLSPRTGIYNEGVRIVREAPKRFAVFSNEHRWGHFRRLIDAKVFANDVRFGRAFASDVADRLVRP